MGTYDSTIPATIQTSFRPYLTSGFWVDEVQSRVCCPTDASPFCGYLIEHGRLFLILNSSTAGTIARHSRAMKLLREKSTASASKQNCTADSQVLPNALGLFLLPPIELDSYNISTFDVEDIVCSSNGASHRICEITLLQGDPKASTTSAYTEGSVIAQVIFSSASATLISRRKGPEQHVRLKPG